MRKYYNSSTFTKMAILTIAASCHELNRQFCISIGDDSQPTWDNAPDWQKDSAIKGVEFHLDNHEATPASSHESWMKQKTEEGWKYGPVKCEILKEHPCYVEYSSLPVEQQSKDYLFKANIHNMADFYFAICEQDI